ncbi:MAG: hypothetical protein ACJAR3_002948 [Roseivirga sp.]
MQSTRNHRGDARQAKAEAFYFASVMPKPKDVRFYFFPFYTHLDHFQDTLANELKKQLKGQTCFQVKAVTSDFVPRIDVITGFARIDHCESTHAIRKEPPFTKQSQ